MKRQLMGLAGAFGALALVALGCNHDEIDATRHLSGELNVQAGDTFAETFTLFAYDDFGADDVATAVIDPVTGHFEIDVPIDSPISFWVGRFDVDGEGKTVARPIAPMTFALDYQLPPGTDDLTWGYDASLWATSHLLPAGYVAFNGALDGYYAVEYWDRDRNPGTAWFYLVGDRAESGGYVLFWQEDDNSCTPSRVYVTRDASGTYYGVSGLDRPFTLSGVLAAEGELGGDGRVTVVDGVFGRSYYATMTLSRREGEQPFDCPDLTLPADPTDCPAGCSVDTSLGICVTDIGQSCALFASATALWTCPDGCSRPAGDPYASACYDDASGNLCLWP